MANIRFNKVTVLPTSGMKAGDIYFVSSTNEIYVYNGTEFEKYSQSVNFINLTK